MGTDTLYETEDGIPMPPPYAKVQRGRESVWILQGWMRDVDQIRYHGYNILYNQLKAWLPDGVGDTIEILIKAKRAIDDPQYWARNSNFQGIPEEPTAQQQDYGGPSPHEWPTSNTNNKTQHQQLTKPRPPTEPNPTATTQSPNKNTVTRAE